MPTQTIARAASTFALLLIVLVPPASAGAPGANPAPVIPVPDPSTTLTLPRHDIAGLPNFARVSRDLYRGAQPTAGGFRKLAEMGVRTVVSLRMTNSDRGQLQGTGLRYLRIPVEPWNPESDEMVRFLKVVSDPANRPVFVHCRQGVDRTGAAVAVYRMVEQNWNTGDAIAELDRFGHNAIFTHVKQLLRRLDRARIRERVKAAPTPKLDTIP